MVVPAIRHHFPVLTVFGRLDGEPVITLIAIIAQNDDAPDLHWFSEVHLPPRVFVVVNVRGPVVVSVAPPAVVGQRGAMAGEGA